MGETIESLISQQPATLGAQLLEAGFDASQEWLALEQALANDGLNVLTELFRDHRDSHFDCWAHFPADDARDPVSGARFYYHAHDPADWSLQEHGHFHLFIPNPRDPENPDDFCHIGAVSMSNQGVVDSLFMTNQWVTAESWVPAAELVAVLPAAFTVERARPSYLVSRWLTSLVTLCALHLAQLLEQRDQAVLSAAGDGVDPAILSDQDRHILARMPVDIQAIAEAWQQGHQRFF